MMICAFEKVPLVHSQLIAVILKQKQEVERQRRNITDEEKKELDGRKSLIKLALWALSNIAAGSPYCLDQMLSDDSVDHIL